MPAVAAAIPGILINVAAGIAINAAVGFVSNAILGSADQSRTSRGVERSPRAGVNEPVRVMFGEFATPGRFWHQNSYGSDNDYLQLVFECGRTEYDSLSGMLAGGKAVSLSGSNANPKGRVIDAYTVGGVPHAWVKFYTGAAGQTADAELVARANPPERWPSTKTMTGTAYVIITVRYDEKVFEGGLPEWTFIWKGAKLYDRRKDSTQPGGSGSHRWGQPATYEWTANPAIILDNFRRGLWINGVRVLGIGVNEAACHHARTVAAANLCDETVFYDDTGRTLPRYIFGGEISDAEDQISVVRMLETAMAGYGAEFGGAYAPLPAQTMSSVLTLTDKDRVTGSDVSERTRLDPTQVKTAFNGMFVSKANGWVEKEYGLRADTTGEALEGGRRQGKLDLEFITEQEIAASVAEVIMRRDRYSASEVATFGPKAAKLEPGDVVTRVSALLGTVPMMVWSVREQSGARYQLTLRRWDNAIVPDPTEGFVPILPDPIAAPVPDRPITVSGLLALAATQVSGSNTVPAIRVTWTPITDRTVDRVLIKYWRDGEPDDARYLSVDDPGAGLAVIEGVVPDADYVMTATIVTTPPRTTIWSAESAVTTGPLTVVAEVPPIAPEMLGPELAADHGFLTSTDEGSLSELIDNFRQDMDNLAGAVATANMTANVIRQLVEARFGSAAAAVFTEQQVRATQYTALATQITEVLAQVDEVIADGYLRFESVVDGGGALATITAKVKASAGAAFSQAAWILSAEADGAGGTNAYFGVMGTFYVFKPDGSRVPAFAVDVANNRVRFNDWDSIATVSGIPIIQMHGSTGDFSISVS